MSFKWLGTFGGSSVHSQETCPSLRRCGNFYRVATDQEVKTLAACRICLKISARLARLEKRAAAATQPRTREILPTGDRLMIATALYLPAEQRDALIVAAGEEGRAMAALVREAIAEWLTRRAGGGKAVA